MPMAELVRSRTNIFLLCAIRCHAHTNHIIWIIFTLVKLAIHCIKVDFLKSTTVPGAESLFSWWLSFCLHCFAHGNNFCLVRGWLQLCFNPTWFRGSSFCWYGFQLVSWFILMPQVTEFLPPEELLQPHFWWRAWPLRGPARGNCVCRIIVIHFLDCYQEELGY